MFPREIHHIVPLESPECWVTCDSIGLFLETECQFPSEPNEDCYYHHEDHELIPRFRRQRYALARSFVKTASVELIDLYRRFVSPAHPRFLLLHLSSAAFRGVLGHFHRFVYCTIGRRPEGLVLSPCSIWTIFVLVSSPPPAPGSIVPGARRCDPPPFS